MGSTSYNNQGNDNDGCGLIFAIFCTLCVLVSLILMIFNGD